MHLVHLERHDFSGPLDLLLELIQLKKLEITEISLASITTEYLSRLDRLSSRDPAELASFLHIASRLLLIKSRALLEAPGGEADQEIPLEIQLKIYQAYRQAAETLQDLESRGQSFAREGGSLTPEPVFTPISAEELAYLNPLYQSLISQRLPIREPESVPLEQVSLTEISTYLRSLLERDRQIDLTAILTRCHSRLEVVVTFLATLDLLRERLGRISQPMPFGPILVEAR